MDLYKHERTKYDVPLSHLDFGYIDKCKDVKELEKILKILRSGCEGYYPDLETLAEKKLEALNPNSKVLRTEKPALLKNYLDKTEKEQLDAELKFWENEIRSQETSVLEAGKQEQQHTDEKNLPPVRGSASSIPLSKKTAEEKARKQRRVKPRDYREWDKVDIDAELAKIDGEEPKPTNKNVLRSKTDLPERVDTTGLTEPEKVLKADREKDKGNEAFRAGDYNEALLYYKRSITLLPTAAAYNNRAQTYLKMKKWTDAYKDCNVVLDMEPNNIKALLRRAMASNGCHDYIQAKNDLMTLLHKEPGNKRAKQLLAEVEKNLADQKVKGRRMVIEEVEGSDECSSDEEESKKEQSEPATMTAGQIKRKDAQNKTKPKLDRKQKEKDIWTEEDLETQSMPNGDTWSGKQASVVPDVLPACKPSELKSSMEEIEQNPNEKASKTKRDLKTPEKSDKHSSQDTPVLNTEVAKANAYAKKEQATVSSTSVPPSELPESVKKIKADGNELFKCGQYPEAVQKYDKCIEKLLRESGSHSHNLSLLYCNRAAALQKMGDCRSSIDDCNNALKLEPTNIKALARRARAYEDIEKYREAYVDYRQILLLDSSVDIAQQGSTRCSQMLIRQDGAKWREKLPVITPIVAPSISTLEKFAECDETKKKTSDMKPEKKSQLSKDELFEKHKNDGNAFVKKGDHNSAISCYTKCIEYCPDNVVAYTNRALCYLKTKQFDKVVTDCTKVLAVEKDNVKALFRRALAYKGLQQFEDSVKDFKHILKVDAKNGAARKEFAVVLREKQKFEEKQATSVKQRRHVQIEEVESSESENDSDTDDDKDQNLKQGGRKHPSVNTAQSNVKTESRSSKQSVKQTRKKKDVPSSEKRAPLKKSLPVLAKITPYEFMQAWISVKLQNDIKAYSSLLSQVPPTRLNTVLTNKLDGHMLSILIKCVGYLVEAGDTNKALEYLLNIPRVSRFGVVSMFMSDGDKKDVSRLLKLLKKSLGSQITDEQLSYLKKQYQI